MKIKNQVSQSWSNRSNDYKEKSRNKATTAAKSSCLYDTTNAEFAKHNGKFRQDCELAGLPPTARQASKYRRGFGDAYNAIP